MKGKNVVWWYLAVVLWFELTMPHTITDSATKTLNHRVPSVPELTLA
jgi:hypothetical protein